MNSKNESKAANNKKNFLGLYLEGDETVYDLAIDDDSAFKELSEIEESLHGAIKYENSKYLDSLLDEDSLLLENLDIAKAKSRISKEKK
jgi:hypothetical protein